MLTEPLQWAHEPACAGRDSIFFLENTGEVPRTSLQILCRTPINQKPPDAYLAVFSTAGPRGFEPRSTVLETVILPLNYRPVSSMVRELWQCVNNEQ